MDADKKVLSCSIGVDRRLSAAHTSFVRHPAIGIDRGTAGLLDGGSVRFLGVPIRRVDLRSSESRRGTQERESALRAVSSDRNREVHAASAASLSHGTNATEAACTSQITE